MSVRFVKHSELNPTELEAIAMLKGQHWIYGVESQKKWIDNQFLPEDLHVILYKGNSVVAYVGLNKVKCLIDGTATMMWGIGNVCVDKSCQGTGLGIDIMKEVNAYIESKGQAGVLLCHEQLCKFYSKVEWKIVSYGKAFIKADLFYEYLMFYNSEVSSVGEIVFDKNF